MHPSSVIIYRYTDRANICGYIDVKRYSYYYVRHVLQAMSVFIVKESHYEYFTS